MSNINYHTRDTTTKASKPFFKNWFGWIGIIGIIPIVAFVLFLGYEFMIQLPKAKQVQTQLEIEFNAIHPLPSASIVKDDTSYKARHAVIGATYLTNISPDDIFKYYDGQLRQHGWQLNGTSGVKDWGRDLGGKSAEYCKGDYAAELQYAGQQANYGWTYAFGMSWGLHDCKTQPEEGQVK